MATIEEILVNIRANVGGFLVGMKNAERSIKRFNATAARAGVAVGKLRNKVATWSKEFSGWALSTMFFGMMIQRVFTSIAKSGLKTFKDIAGSQSAQVQGLARLQAAWTFLKFSIGNVLATALLPLIPRIVEIVKLIVDWINRNPELVAKIIAVGAAVGFLMFTIGSLVLGIKGLINGFFAIASVGKTISGGVAALAAVFGVSTGVIWLVVGAIAALVVGFIILWNRSKKFRDFWISLWELIKESVLLAVDVIVLATTWVVDQIQKAWGILPDWLQEHVWNAIKNGFKAMLDLVTGGLWRIIQNVDTIISKFRSATQAIKGARSSVQSRTESIRGSRQSGGNIPATGLYRLHRGEHVVGQREAQSGIGGGISIGNITMNVSGGNMDGRKLFEEFRRELRRYGA